MTLEVRTDSPAASPAMIDPPILPMMALAMISPG
jgi:hypothetical protein